MKKLLVILLLAISILGYSQSWQPMPNWYNFLHSIKILNDSTVVKHINIAPQTTNPVSTRSVQIYNKSGRAKIITNGRILDVDSLKLKGSQSIKILGDSICIGDTVFKALTFYETDDQNLVLFTNGDEIHNIEAYSTGESAHNIINSTTGWGAIPIRNSTTKCDTIEMWLKGITQKGRVTGQGFIVMNTDDTLACNDSVRAMMSDNLIIILDSVSEIISDSLIYVWDSISVHRTELNAHGDSINDLRDAIENNVLDGSRSIYVTDSVYLNDTIFESTLYLTGDFINPVLKTSGATATNGYWNTGVVTLSGTSRLNYNGYLYATKFYSGAGEVVGVYDFVSSSVKSSLYAGYQSGIGTTGNENNFFGYRCYPTNYTGKYSTGIGQVGGSQTSGDGNTDAGYQTSNARTSGAYDANYGFRANLNVKTGSYNTNFGANSGSNRRLASSRNISLGYNTIGKYIESDALYIDNRSDTVTPFIWGDMDKDSLVINADLTVTGTITGTITSLETDPKYATDSSKLKEIERYIISDSSKVVHWPDTSLFVGTKTDLASKLDNADTMASNYQVYTHTQAKAKSDTTTTVRTTTANELYKIPYWTGAKTLAEMDNIYTSADSTFIVRKICGANIYTGIGIYNTVASTSGATVQNPAFLTFYGSALITGGTSSPFYWHVGETNSSAATPVSYFVVQSGTNGTSWTDRLRINNSGAVTIYGGLNGSAENTISLYSGSTTSPTGGLFYTYSTDATGSSKVKCGGGFMHSSSGWYNSAPVAHRYRMFGIPTADSPNSRFVLVYSHDGTTWDTIVEALSVYNVATQNFKINNKLQIAGPSINPTRYLDVTGNARISTSIESTHGEYFWGDSTVDKSWKVSKSADSLIFSSNISGTYYPRAKIDKNGRLTCSSISMSSSDSFVIAGKLVSKQYIGQIYIDNVDSSISVAAGDTVTIDKFKTTGRLAKAINCSITDSTITIGTGGYGEYRISYMNEAQSSCGIYINDVLLIEYTSDYGGHKSLIVTLDDGDVIKIKANGSQALYRPIFTVERLN